MKGHTKPRDGERLPALPGTLMMVVMVASALFFVLPIVMVMMNAFKPLGGILTDILGFPETLYLENFAYVIKRMNYFTLFRNSAVITVSSVAGIVLLSSMCAYKLSRTKSRKSSAILMVFLSSIIVPFHATMITLARVAYGLNFNSIFGTIVITIALNCPFAIFMYERMVKYVPSAIDDAARIDGCSDLRLFFQIIFPMLSSTTASVIVLNTVWIWNDFSLPLILLQTPDEKTVTLGIYSFFSHTTMRWDYALAGLTMVLLPMLIFYIFMQRYIVVGIVESSVKG